MQNLKADLARYGELDKNRTPGDWRRGYTDESGMDHIIAPDNDGDAIASTDPYGTHDDYNIPEQAGKDADFIAAAPSIYQSFVTAMELLGTMKEALEELVNLERQDNAYSAIKRATEALARAREAGL